jgi:hypothetical protein
VLGGLAEYAARDRQPAYTVAPAPVNVAPAQIANAPTVPSAPVAPPAPVVPTHATTGQATSSRPMSSANSLFGR